VPHGVSRAGMTDALARGITVPSPDADVAAGGPTPDADVAGVSPVYMRMRRRRASRGAYVAAVPYCAALLGATFPKSP
jgi:hypothetical protein